MKTFDEEMDSLGSWITENQLKAKQLKEKAIECDRLLTRNLLQNLYLIKEIKEQKLYTYLGFNSLEDYGQNRLNLARSTLFGYLQVASKFLPAIIDDKQVSPVQQLDFSELGIEKLKILAILSENLISELITSGSITLDNKTYTIEDFKQMDRDKLRDSCSGY